LSIHVCSFLDYFLDAHIIPHSTHPRKVNVFVVVQYFFGEMRRLSEKNRMHL